MPQPVVVVEVLVAKPRQHPGNVPITLTFARTCSSIVSFVSFISIPLPRFRLIPCWKKLPLLTGKPEWYEASGL